MIFPQQFKKFLAACVNSSSVNEDQARREFIFNVISLSIVVLTGSVLSIHFVRTILGLQNAIPLTAVSILLIFFLFLYFLSRKGFPRLASIILLSILTAVVTYQEYKWGVDLPMKILSQALIVVMAGILINTLAAFIATLLISFSIGLIAYTQKTGGILADRYWTAEVWGTADVVVAVILLLIIATVSWLSNREIEKSIRRAKRSESELKQERDNLEIAVEQRARELKEAQAEKMGQLYRFAEFGRLSSGLFHDLINPLNAVSLNMEKLKSRSSVPIDESADYVEKAIISARKLEDLVAAVRKQIVREESSRVAFSLIDEIRYVDDVLSHKARKANVVLNFKTPGGDIRIMGDPIKFNQIALNLVANAIDSYPPGPLYTNEPRTVTVTLEDEGDKAVLRVADNGSGISGENIDKIFEPFFTTKSKKGGIGLGLAITKRIIENDFGGAISVKSEENKGTVFTVLLKK